MLDNLTIEDTICKNCGAQPEYTHHLFYKCEVAQYIWKQLTSLIKQAWNIKIQTEQENILFLKKQTNATTEQDNRISHIIMAFKYTISRLRFTPSVPNPPACVVDAMLNSQIKIIKAIMRAEEREDEDWNSIPD